MNTLCKTMNFLLILLNNIRRKFKLGHGPQYTVFARMTLILPNMHVIANEQINLKTIQIKYGFICLLFCICTALQQWFFIS